MPTAKVKGKTAMQFQPPCTLCARANADCLPSSRWRIETGQKRASDKGRRVGSQTAHAAQRLRRSRRDTVAGTSHETDEQQPRLDVPPRRLEQIVAEPPAGTTWNSSSTIHLVQEAFHHHDAATPQDTATSAFSASQWAYPEVPRGRKKLKHGIENPLQRLLPRHAHRDLGHNVAKPSATSAMEKELLDILPSHDSGLVLINNYFDKIHWFMLLFHQTDFRDKFEQLHKQRQQGPANVPASQCGYMAVLLAVCAISIEYTTRSQKDDLMRKGIQPDHLKESILSALRLRLLDILAMGSLEAVQTCVLLSSYYLYHGQPELAWPLCGCAQRIAQALNLHRNFKSLGGSEHGQTEQPVIAARQRCWWAVYEIETTCAMMYGFPSSISDQDCDAEALDPHDESSASTAGFAPSAEPNLLVYKCAMSSLTKIVKCALTDLYGNPSNVDNAKRSDSGHTTRLHSLMSKVSDLDKTLAQWLDGLPVKLRPTELDLKSSLGCPLPAQHNNHVSFREQLFQLQALALKLAYENSRILIHRPLLSFNMAASEGGSPRQAASPDPFQHSVETCRDAALQIAMTGSIPIFHHATKTYIVSFVSLHLFTAGVTLCIMASLDPLRPQSHESKVGIRALMEMQNVLKTKSIVATQGLGILRNLLSLVMAKEIDVMFRPGSVGVDDEPETRNTLPAGAQPQIAEPNALYQSEEHAAAETPRPEGHDDTALRAQDLGPGAEFGFCENLGMTEALLDFEQVIGYSGGHLATGQQSASLGDSLPTNQFVGQDQGWLWGWNLDV
ncbi:hypothetical protein H634G_07479 [Metarhizium anisopliae BRIP 53293]|uniref:Xylanolytic transcriptional activator regulatory domain-containing protein n=1 Tax=Metarhizium anisopliae BRIP 53293 TaxID=1291518 RepID=A0A0D9NT04_METAN|nr:hypothetical protein H634G_07479 [Metarhizium anisopliae BRIP 53293]